MTKEIISVDSCIIGSGLNGLWTALELARKGQKILLIDKTPIGSNKQSIDVCLSYACDTKLYDLALKAQHKWFTLSQKFSNELDFELRGSLSFALNKEEMDHLDNILLEQKECNNDLGSFILQDRQALKALLKTQDLGESVRGALISVEDMSVNHQACIEFLRQQLIQTGAQFWGSDKVIDFDIDDKTIKSISTKEATVEAKNFILATGAESSKLFKKLHLHMPVRPSRAHLIEYTSKARLPKQILHYKGKLGDYICKPMLNGRSILMYTGVEDQMQATWSSQTNQQTVVASLVEMMRVLPSLKYVDIQDSSIIHLAITPDRLPYFGKTKFYKNLYLNIGFSGSKYLFVPLFAEQLANMLVKNESASEFKFLNPDRFAKDDYSIDYSQVQKENSPSESVDLTESTADTTKKDE